MTGGYFKLFRKFKRHPLWTKPREFSHFEAWLDLITDANFEDGVQYVDGRLRRVARGQLLTSVLKLSKRWRWSPKKVRRFMDTLKEQEMIAWTASDHRVTLISILNYARLQTRGTTEGQLGNNSLFKKEKKGKYIRESFKEQSGIPTTIPLYDCPICEHRHPINSCPAMQGVTND